MVETSARLLRLLSLFQGRRYWSGADLAERLEITTRTLRRDVDKLRALGYPIHSTSGTEGGYQLGAGSEMPPLLLDDEEAVAVTLGLRSVAAGSIRGIEEVSARALSKIEQILPPRLATRVAALQSMIVTAASSPAAAASADESRIDGRTLSILVGACRDQLRLQFRYQDRVGKPSARLVEPYRVVHPGLRWYLLAWDLDRKDWRTFRVDRIAPRGIKAGSRFTPRELPAKDLAAYVTKGMWQAPPCRARIKVMASAEELAKRLPRWVGMVEPIDDYSCYFETGAPSYTGLAMHLTFLNAPFEVDGPPELVEQIQRIADHYHHATASIHPKSA